jgi:CRP/FNR family transcriptional regulator, nitrogen oxide reductase regulator
VTDPRAGADPATADPAASCSVDVRLAMLGRTPLFAGLSRPELDAVNDHCRAVAALPGEAVFRTGDPAEALYVIATGQVKLLEHTADGRLVLLDLCVPGEFFGGTPALGDEAYAYDAHCAMRGCLLRLPARAFERLLHDLPRVALNALELTARRLREAQRTVQALSAASVKAQVAATLVRLADKLGAADAARIEVALTQADIAAMSGTTPESVNRVLRELRGAGLVEVGRGWFTLHDRAALEAFTAPP